MKILLIGGTGIISSGVAHLAVARGFEVHLLVRGKSESLRPAPSAAQIHLGDLRQEEALPASLEGHHFDAVIDFVAFVEGHAKVDVELFSGRCKQFVFISSASAYQKPVRKLPITESTPLFNPFWQYSRDKIACEEYFMDAYRQEGFPITIVRPSHTYDETLLPFDPHGAGGTVLARMLAGEEVVVHGDGTSLWTLTHRDDFAQGLLGILGHPAALGEAFQITSEETLPWNEVYEAIARAAQVPCRLVHVPSEVIARHHPGWGAGLLGDKMHSVHFDNSKLRSFCPDFQPKIRFFEGARAIVAYHLARPERLRRDPEVDALMNQLIEKMRNI